MLKKCNRFISAFLALMMLCTLLPASALAVGNTAQNEDTSNPTVHEWTVTFEANGGTGTMPEQKVQSEAETMPFYLPSNNFTAPEGMEFAYWTVSGFEGEYLPGDVVNISSDITVTANWRETGEYYFVTFNPNGGSGTMDSVLLETPSLGEVVYYDVPDCEYTAPTGMVFSHWILEGTEEEYYPGDTLEVSTNVVLVAQWVEIEDSEQSFFG